jgi:hypothetical protein
MRRGDLVTSHLSRIDTFEPPIVQRYSIRHNRTVPLSQVRQLTTISCVAIGTNPTYNHNALLQPDTLGSNLKHRRFALVKQLFCFEPQC